MGPSVVGKIFEGLRPLLHTAVAAFASTVGEKVMEKPDREPSAGEFQKHQEQITKGLTEEFQKREKQYQKQLAVLVGAVCIILVGLVGGSVTWYVLQSGQPSEQIISLEELEKYEKARDAGLQALENYIIQNPNSPYISQAKALIRTYKGKE
jgi:hypothetical protein